LDGGVDIVSCCGHCNSLFGTFWTPIATFGTWIATCTGVPIAQFTEALIATFTEALIAQFTDASTAPVTLSLMLGVVTPCRLSVTHPLVARWNPIKFFFDSAPLLHFGFNLHRLLFQ
jgi:hypothetical protein